MWITLSRTVKGELWACRARRRRVRNDHWGELSLARRRVCHPAGLEHEASQRRSPNRIVSAERRTSGALAVLWSRSGSPRRTLH